MKKKKVVVITEPVFWRGEVDALRLLLQLGVTYIHLRKPGATEEDMRTFLSSFSFEEKQKMVLHDYPNLAQEFCCGGIHHNSRNCSVPSGWKGRLSRSCHTISEVKQHKCNYDYLFLSPIFDSISKQNYRQSFSKEELEVARKVGVIDDSVLALGGMTQERLSEIFLLGFGGAVFLGDIWRKKRSPDFVSYVQTIIKSSQLMHLPVVLSVAGSDPSAGAGIQADLKTISSIGAYGLTAITAVTIQNTQGVKSFIPISKGDLLDQIRVLHEDFSIDVVKIGMLPDEESVKAVVEALQTCHFKKVVYDPVMISTAGQTLMSSSARNEICQNLFPFLNLITPNLNEAEWLLSKNITTKEDMIIASQEIGRRWKCSVLLKGGHLESEEMVDVLYHQGEIELFSHSKIVTTNLHGTGCTLSSAIATYMAFGYELSESVRLAKNYISDRIQNSHSLRLGQGCGPMWHF